jgi:pimeloyl-ACP methyl ester carboxylesterase
MPNPVLIVHGWSDNYKSFVPLQTWLATQGRPAQQVFFGNYDSMEDHVTFDDLAAGLQDRFDDLKDKGTPVLAPFSLDVIVHSTGGPVVRHWLYHYLTDKCKGDLTKCPIRRLIMLAPANFGSRLAAEGKTALAKLFKGGVSHGFETGQLILDGLELGSPQLWGMALNDMFSGKSFYPCVRDQGPFVFVFSGTDMYGELKGLVAPGANEDGSDGTIRASAASLNSIMINVDYVDPKQPFTTVLRPENSPIAFRLVPGVNHTEIVPRDANNANHPTFALILRCMAVGSSADYDALRTQFDAETAALYAGQLANRVHAFQQFVVHVCDELANDVLDYHLDFHVVDNTIHQSTWVPGDEASLAPLRQYQKYTTILQQEVIADVETHSENSSYRTFFINIDRLNQLQAQMRAEVPLAYIAMNLDAAGPTKDLGYDTDQLHYLRVEVPIPDGRGGSVAFFLANTTTLIEIKLLNVPTVNVMNLFPASQTP